MNKILLGVQEPAQGYGIDFDVVAKKEDVDLLREAVLEILAATLHGGSVKSYFGPACDQLLKEREESKP